MYGSFTTNTKKKEFHSMKRQRSNGIKSTRIIRWSKGDYVEEQYWNRGSLELKNSSPEFNSPETPAR